ncbi:hypothetical protein ACWEOW_03360 [Monashia sp. NPDC004114]
MTDEFESWFARRDYEAARLADNPEAMRRAWTRGSREVSPRMPDTSPRERQEEER